MIARTYSFIATILILFSLTLTGCGSDDSKPKSQDAVPGRFLGATAFQVDAADTSLSVDEFTGQVDSSSVFLVHTAPEFAPEEGQEPNTGCGFARDEVVIAGDGALELHVEANSTGCPEETGDNGQHTEVKVYVRIACSETDLSESPFLGLSGSWSFGKINYRGMCLGDAQVSAVMNAEVFLRRSNEDGSTRSGRLLGAFMRPDGSPCAFKAGETEGTSVLDECGYYSKSVDTASDGTVESRRSLSHYKGVVAAAGARYFREGTIDFEFSDWQGTMTYTGDDIAPSYEASNESDTISGVLNDGAGLNLFGKSFEDLILP